MDREAWGAAIHGAARSRTRLSNWTELLKKTEWNRKQVLERIWRNRCPCALLIGWNHYGHSMKVPQKIKNSITAWLNTLTSGYLLKRMHRSPRICKISMKYLHTHVHNSTIPNSQEAEAVHVPTEWMDEWINNIRQIHKRNITQPWGHPDTCYDMDKPRRHMLSEISQSQEDKYRMIPLVWRTKRCHSEKEKVLIERQLPEAGGEGW